MLAGLHNATHGAQNLAPCRLPRALRAIAESFTKDAIHALRRRHRTILAVTALRLDRCQICPVVRHRG